MSPEQNAKTPEQRAEKPYVTAAKEVILTADQNAPGTTERFKVVDSHVDKILEAVDKGEITGSAGTYTREQLLLQFEDFLTKLNMTDEQLKGEDPYSYIPSKDGMRASFRLLMGSDATYRDFQDSLRMHVSDEHEKRAKLLSADEIEKMGDVEVSAAGVDEPMVEARRAATGIIEGIPDHLKSRTEAEVEAPEAPKLTRAEYLRKLTEGLSEADVARLRSFAEATAAKQRAQRNGEGDNSIYWGQQLGQSYREMSAIAQSISSQYAHAYNHYT